MRSHGLEHDEIGLVVVPYQQKGYDIMYANHGVENRDGEF
jgi:hypothetical protein